MTDGSRTWLSRTDLEQLDWGPNLPSDMDGGRGRGRCPLLRAARARGLGAREGRANGEPGGPPVWDRCTKVRVDTVERVVVKDRDGISWHLLAVSGSTTQSDHRSLEAFGRLQSTMPL